SLFDLNVVGLQDGGQFLVADQRAAVTEVAYEVDQYAATLHALDCEVLDAQLLGTEACAVAAAAVGVFVRYRVGDIVARPVAVVVDLARLSIAVDVELRAHVSQRIPLSG